VKTEPPAKQKPTVKRIRLPLNHLPLIARAQSVILQNVRATIPNRSKLSEEVLGR
jgi:hypothetical protein